MDNIINFDLISDWLNWIIVFLVLYLWAVVAQVLYNASQGNTIISFPQGL